MRKSKDLASYRYHYIICTALAMLLLTTIRYPVVFLDNWYWLTRIFYFVVGVLVFTYGLWLFQRLGMRYLAVFIIGVAMLVGAGNMFRFSLPFNAECDFYEPNKRVCFMAWVEYDSLTYANWSEVTFFRTLGELPVGIWYQSRHLE